MKSSDQLAVLRYCTWLWEQSVTLSRDPVCSHAGVVLAVTPGCPQEQSGCHHLQREGDEGEVEGPAQRALHPFWWCGVLVEQIHACQETADGAQGAQTWGVEVEAAWMFVFCHTHSLQENLAYTKLIFTTILTLTFRRNNTSHSKYHILTEWSDCLDNMRYIRISSIYLRKW